ncbi:MAG TPA: DNA-binding domain-containing protein [Steroidobacteraceae bacterium]|nr:DNA-binding domain-containing protein [Steroidobacteraceae bacterium]
MRPWAERQREFAAALLDPARAVPEGVADPAGRACPKRFSVYRNNIAVAWIEALRESFPAVCRIVGEEFFCAAAQCYAASEPPGSPVLTEYGAGFARFLERFEPAASLPYLPDVARIERAWIEAYHARDASPLDPAALEHMASDRVRGLRFAAHPSLRLVRSRYRALTIWRMNVADGVPEPIDPASDEDALLVRPGAEVAVRSIPPGGARFIEALARGEPLGAAAQATQRDHADFDLAEHLSQLLECGAFAGFWADVAAES